MVYHLVVEAKSAAKCPTIWDSPPLKRTIQPKMPIVPRLRYPGLIQYVKLK